MGMSYFNVHPRNGGGMFFPVTWALDLDAKTSKTMVEFAMDLQTFRNIHGNIVVYLYVYIVDGIFPHNYSNIYMGINGKWWFNGGLMGFSGNYPLVD